MRRPHGSPPRGMENNPISPAFEGTYGRMFRTLPAAKFTIPALMKLGDLMVSKDRPDLSEGLDDEENQGIDAGYTYFGQFIDHDLTFDPASSLQKKDDPNGLVDFRTPRFDLDNLYGRGPDDQPYMYETDGLHLILGDPLEGNPKDKHAKGLPRNNAHPARAIIGDPRNDENVLVSQVQMGFLRFHNWMTDHLLAKNPKTTFETIQRHVRWHYQWLIINEFLPKIIGDKIIPEILPVLTDPPKLKLYSWKKFPFIPVEFSVAVYRFGHSMVRPFYRLNPEVKKTIFATEMDESLDGFRKTPKGWAIDWDLLLNPEGPNAIIKEPIPIGPTRVQKAYKIDTSLVNPLIDLFKNHAVSDPPPNLAQRNLIRGMQFSLPSGQTVARFMGEEVIPDSELFVGKATEDSTNGNEKAKVPKNQPIVEATAEFGAEFVDNAPLWFYVLAEAQHDYFHGSNSDPIRLGRVGGRIVAEVFIGLLLGDQHSYLSQHPTWEPLKALDGKEFSLSKLFKSIQ